MNAGKPPNSRSSLSVPLRRRWIGPGLLFAVLASLLVWRLLPGLPGEIRGAPPHVERVPIEENRTAPPSAPDPEWLLGQRKTLNLTEPQVRKLVQLQARWERSTRGLREALDRASAEFKRSMSPAGDRRVSIEEIQARTAPVSALSRDLAEARRAWWAAAGAVLTAEQRRQVEEAWMQRLSRPSPPRSR